MSLKIRKSGTPTDATTVKYRSGSGWAQPSAVKRRVSGTWVQVWPTSSPLAISADSYTASGSSPGTAANSTYVTVTASGGTGWYSYSWARISGDKSTTCVNPSSAATQWRRTSMQNGREYQSVWRCTVSDGSTSKTLDVTVSIVSGEGPITCVVVETYVSPFDDTQAGGLAVNDPLYITDAYSAQPDVTVAPARKSHTYQAECVRVTLANGAVLECSLTAPLATRHGFVKARDVLDCELASAPRDQVAGMQPLEIQWSTVVSVVGIGVRAVQLIYVEDRAFWASSDGALFILHHNAKVEP